MLTLYIRSTCKQAHFDACKQASKQAHAGTSAEMRPFSIAFFSALLRRLLLLIISCRIFFARSALTFIFSASASLFCSDERSTVSTKLAMR